FIGWVMVQASCSKKNNGQSGNSRVAGFWTYKTDPNNSNNYWNGNVLFKSDGTFRMYTALSLDDTLAINAIADTANQVITIGTYTVSGQNLKMVWQEFNVIGFKATGIFNSSFTNFTGNLEINQPGSASPLWILTKP
ncbi:MAG: hypothetical protein JST13_11225, partial [Bacteroidetes bacterium]|nr:hypothetical protein [Bacteroidota bacterium]